MKKILLSFILVTSSFCQSQSAIELETFATGFTPIGAIVNAGDNRLFVVELAGRIKIVDETGTVNTTPFLTIPASALSVGGERGLLGLAFHPDYANTGYFYVNYTRSGDGATVIARFEVSDSPDIATLASEEILMVIPQPYSNHNGGTLAFGPDGYLYIGMGDGGSGGDPQNYAQNNQSLLGKMLRIDVDNGSPYGIPADNPFADGVAGEAEIWATGLRNPWKFSFHRTTGDLWIADVGQNAFEEINKVSFPLTPGLNFGWRCYEGNQPYNTNGCGPAEDYTFPIATYPLSAGYCAITGGYVYTGTEFPNFQGRYFFADYCGSRIGWIPENGGSITWTPSFGGSFTSLGEDVQGELYVAAAATGTIFKITDPTMNRATFRNPLISLSPNPAKDIVTLHNDHQLVLETFILYDMTGKKILEQALNNNPIQTIGLSSLKSGFYQVRIGNKTGQSYSYKLLIK